MSASGWIIVGAVVALALWALIVYNRIVAMAAALQSELR